MNDHLLNPSSDQGASVSAYREESAQIELGPSALLNTSHECSSCNMTRSGASARVSLGPVSVRVGDSAEDVWGAMASMYNASHNLLIGSNELVWIASGTQRS